MTQANLRDAVLGRLPADRARFDPITLILIGALISSVVAHFVEEGLAKCEHKAIRNPGMFTRWKLRRAIRSHWSDPSVARAAVIPGVNAAALDRMYGDDVYAALVATVATLTDAEIDALRAS